jgi:peptidoglycan endopeptidase LytE
MQYHRPLAIAFVCLTAALALLAVPVCADTTYTVSKGESIWSIAEKLSVPYLPLLKANSLTEDSLLFPGQRLVVPDLNPPEAERPAGAKTETRPYVVQRGDNLSLIAQRFGVPVKALVRANDITNPNLIHPGRRLVIPAPGLEPASEEGTDPLQSSLVETALHYRGVPYRYAGMTTRGMDCSGLVARVLRTHGIDAPHNSKALYKLGKPVAKGDLQPGDLVFFHTTRPGISHVGIYIGNGKFVHASSSRGSVRVDQLDSGYYQKRLVGARRLP